MKTSAPRRPARLSGKQIKSLILCARRAWKTSGSTQDFDTWRRDQVMAAVGKVGLTQCGNDDYSALMARFEQGAGRDDKAFDHAVRAQSERRRQLEHELVEAMRRGGFSPVYVQTICTAEYKCLVEDTTEAQLLRLVITIKNRARNKKAREPKAAAAAAPAPAKPTTPNWCPHCHGEGWVQDNDIFADTRARVTCPQCHGAKVLKTEVAA